MMSTTKLWHHNDSVTMVIPPLFLTKKLSVYKYVVFILLLPLSRNVYSLQTHSLTRKNLGFYLCRQATSITLWLSSAASSESSQKKEIGGNIQDLLIKNQTHHLKQSSLLVQEMQHLHQSGTQLTQEYCDIILANCVANDEWDLVLDVLDTMKQQGLQQVQSTYKACLQACFHKTNAASASEILMAMQQAGIAPDGNDVGAVVATMCRKETTEKGWWRKARQLLPAKNVPVGAYDAVLYWMVLDKQWQDAIQLLQIMYEEGNTEPALSTYRLVIECCTVSRQTEQAFHLLLGAVQRGIVPTLYSFELVINALCKRLQWRRVLQLLELMDKLQVPKTIVVYNTVLTALSKARQVSQAKALLTQMRKSGIKPDVISFNAVISVCASAGEWKDALNVFDQCHREPGVLPDIYTYTNAMRACAKGEQMRRALSLLQVVKDKGMDLDAFAYTAVIEACAKSKDWKKALELLQEMEERGISPTEVTYSVTITACGNGGQWQKALELLDIMRGKKLNVNLITFNAAVTAVSRAAKQMSKTGGEEKDLSKIVIQLIGQMRDAGIEPDGFTYSSAISCCGAEGRWEEALVLIETMQNGGPRTRPNKIAYTAAISSCGRSGQVDHALRLFRQMKDQGLSADRVAYNALFAALRVARRADCAYGLWLEMLGTREMANPRRIAAAKSDGNIGPDIITITDAIGALSTGEDSDINRQRIDAIFNEAVKREIVFRSNSLDSMWEVDISGLSLPVARAAVRYILNRIRSSRYEKEELKDLALITGVGVGRNSSKEDSIRGNERGKYQSTSLREYVQEVLMSDFEPNLSSTILPRARGTIQVDSKTLADWLGQEY